MTTADTITEFQRQERLLREEYAGRLGAKREESTVHVLYRCRRDKVTIRHTFRQVRDLETGIVMSPQGWPQVRTRTSRVRYFAGDVGVSHTWLPSLKCPTCHRHMTCQPINGRLVETVKCNAKCVAAVGPDCECQCGGQNHGQAHERAVFIA